MKKLRPLRGAGFLCANLPVGRVGFDTLARKHPNERVTSADIAEFAEAKVKCCRTADQTTREILALVPPYDRARIEQCGKSVLPYVLRFTHETRRVFHAVDSFGHEHTPLECANDLHASEPIQVVPGCVSGDSAFLCDRNGASRHASSEGVIHGSACTQPRAESFLGGETTCGVEPQVASVTLRVNQARPAEEVQVVPHRALVAVDAARDVARTQSWLSLDGVEDGEPCRRP